MKTKSAKVRIISIIICCIMLFSALPVMAATSSIKLNKTSVQLQEGSTYQLKATVKGKSQKVTWKSSVPSVASVKNGKITAKKAGTCVITAKANGVTAKCKVTVSTANWKEAYADFLQSYKPEFSTTKPVFHLAYINTGNIPELVIADDMFKMTKVKIFTYEGNKVKECGQYGDYGEITYAKKKCTLMRSTMNMGWRVFSIYKMNNKLELKKETVFSDHENLPGQEEYYIDRTQVSKTEYYKKMNALKKDYTFREAGYQVGFSVTTGNINKILMDANSLIK